MGRIARSFEIYEMQRYFSSVHRKTVKWCIFTSILCWSTTLYTLCFMFQFLSDIAGWKEVTIKMYYSKPRPHFQESLCAIGHPLEPAKNSGCRCHWSSCVHFLTIFVMPTHYEVWFSPVPNWYLAKITCALQKGGPSLFDVIICKPRTRRSLSISSRVLQSMKTFNWCYQLCLTCFLRNM